MLLTDHNIVHANCSDILIRFIGLGMISSFPDNEFSDGKKWFTYSSFLMLWQWHLKNIRKCYNMFYKIKLSIQQIPISLSLSLSLIMFTRSNICRFMCVIRKTKNKKKQCLETVRTEQEIRRISKGKRSNRSTTVVGSASKGAQKQEENHKDEEHRWGPGGGAQE